MFLSFFFLNNDDLNAQRLGELLFVLTYFFRMIIRFVVLSCIYVTIDISLL
jgi:hypothetical protein